MNDEEKYVIRSMGEPHYVVTSDAMADVKGTWSNQPAAAHRFSRAEAEEWLKRRLASYRGSRHGQSYYDILSEAELVAAILAGPP